MSTRILHAACVLALLASPLVADEPAKPKEKKVRTVAVLLFEGVELMDFAGPAEVFIVADKGGRRSRW